MIELLLAAGSASEEAAQTTATTLEAGAVMLGTALLMVVTVGASLVIFTGGFDLSAGSVVALTGVVAALVVEHTDNVSLGLAAGDTVTVPGDRGSVALPVGTADLPDDVVWLPGNTGGVNVNRDLASPGSPVRVTGGAA